MDIEESNFDGEKESRLRKLFIALIGIFLVILMLTYILGSNSLYPILESLLESKQAENKTLLIQDTTIIFSNNVWDILQNEYHLNEDQEFSLCLSGGKEENNYYLDEVFYPDIISQSINHVSFKYILQTPFGNLQKL